MLTYSANKRAWRTVCSVLAMLGILTVLAAGAPAGADECQEITWPDGTIEIICGSNGGGGDPGGGDSGGGAGSGPEECRLDGREVPCSSEFGAWDGNCYVRAAVEPVPAQGAPVWGGNDDGLIIECNPFGCLGGPSPCPDRTLDWAASPPVQQGPSAEELAERAVASMNLTTGPIGSTPPAATSDPNAVGTIGLPVWLWIASDADNAVGPIIRSASGGSLTVTATGTLDRVEWTLTGANGNTVGAITCDGANAPGTPYDGRNSAEPSPTCGFGADLNGSPGNLTLTGTAYWSVDWTGGSQEGHIDFTAPSNSTQIRIGELQMLVQD